MLAARTTLVVVMLAGIVELATPLPNGQALTPPM
jgi:hypothetical protein